MPDHFTITAKNTIMKVAVLGSSIVGRVLATAFLKEGHEVSMGTRDVAKKEATDWKAQNPSGQVALFENAINFGELIVLAIPGGAAEEAIKSWGTALLANKLVIDATNPIAAAPPQDGVLQYFTGPNESLMEKLQALAPNARFVKAFNSVGNAYMYKPSFAGGPPTMFICGNDEAAKKIVTDLLHNFGWESVDMGKATAARAIEPLAMLWCIPGMLHNQWSHAFKLLKA